MAMIHYVDPAGNMTAIVRGEFGNEKRVELAKQILQQEKAEQVGFEVPPVNGGDCRLEMMGGEFCGNAVRAFAYLKASEQHSGGRHAVKVEISGAANPVMANVDLSAGSGFRADAETSRRRRGARQGYNASGSAYGRDRPCDHGRRGCR